MRYIVKCLYIFLNISSACRSLETSSLTSAISNKVRGGRRRSAIALDGPSTGRRSGPWVEGGHEDADTQFREYSWNRKIFNIPSGQEIYRGLTRTRAGATGMRRYSEGGRNQDSRSGPRE